MSLASVTGVFPNATVVAGDLTIPSGDIVSYTPSSTTNPGGAEMVFGLLETMNQKVSAAGLTNVTASKTSRLTNNGTVLRIEYAFAVNLDFNTAVIEDLSVKPEPA